MSTIFAKKVPDRGCAKGKLACTDAQTLDGLRLRTGFMLPRILLEEFDYLKIAKKVDRVREECYNQQLLI